MCTTGTSSAPAKPGQAITAEPCWVLVHTSGHEADNGEYVEHFGSEEEAATRAASDVSGNVSGCTPRELDRSCAIARCKTCGYEYDDIAVGHVVHFDFTGDADEAVKNDGWTAQEDGTYSCASCPPDAGQSGETPRG